MQLFSGERLREVNLAPFFLDGSGRLVVPRAGSGRIGLVHLPEFLRRVLWEK